MGNDMKMKLTLSGLGLVLGAGSAHAEGLSLDVELPRLDVAEYHKPYVAIWIANADHSVAANLSVWYQQEDGPEGEGETWLKDMRQWWRRSGRSLELPIDGVSSPTRAPGQHSLHFTENSSQLVDLEAGDYVLCVEASREVGGREVVKLPFTWKSKTSQNVSMSGETELGNITLNIEP